MADFTKGKWEVDGNKVNALGYGIIAICPSTKDGGTMGFIAKRQPHSSSTRYV